MAKNIVIVEDDPDQRNNYIDAIGKKGYSVRGFSSRPEALAGFDEALPDLVILDIILGDEVDAGFELCRDLLSRAPNLPVIFLTERIAEIDKISGLRLGAWDYLPKPISLDYLSEKIS
ncbi:MAG: response regulator [Gammaproteobacteria bacterium]